MKLNKGQILILWYGSILLCALLLATGIQVEQIFLIVLSVIVLISLLFIIAGQEHQIRIIINRKTIVITIFIFLFFLVIFLATFDNFGSSPALLSF
ncbi:MAG: hypothetical protein HOC24_07025 [Deltaproteobacteria bacterium]|jgi:hypothetical protein|nr:hypothetical protein [Deltaproteobacteria bacterium]